MMPQLGKMIVMMGALLIVIGLVLWFAPKIPFLGKLPGDITIKGDHYRIYVPIVTMLILSVLITLILNLFRK